MSRTRRSNWNRYFRHPPKWWRKKESKKFRSKEKQYFKRFQEILVKSKDRGWTFW